MPEKPADGNYTVIGAGRVPFEVRIEIDATAWDACEDDVQLAVIHILENPPIQLLASGGRGNGIKQESRGLEFHTPTDNRLQYPGGTLRERTFRFSRCGKGYGH
jgi:hypothetical protein